MRVINTQIDSIYIFVHSLIVKIVNRLAVSLLPCTPIEPAKSSFRLSAAARPHWK